jgi:hypothetical protein
LRRTAPVAGRAETDLLVVWAMASAFVGLCVFEILFFLFIALNRDATVIYFGAMERYDFTTLHLLRFYLLGLGSHLGLSAMLLVVRKGSARP